MKTASEFNTYFNKTAKAMFQRGYTEVTSVLDLGEEENTFVAACAANWFTCCEGVAASRGLEAVSNRLGLLTQGLSLQEIAS